MASEQVEITEEERKKVREDISKFVDEIESSWAQLGTPLPQPKLVYCMSIYEERMPQVKQCIRRVRPYVDRGIIVVDDTLTEKSKKWLRTWGCEVHYRKWDNYFAKQRNEYLAHVNEGEWVLVSDPDELMGPPLCKDLKNIVSEADKRGINMLGINAHDITVELDGTKNEVVSTFFKNLLFKYEEGVRYVGVVHETLLPGVHGWRCYNLNPEYYYEHIKTKAEIWERAARNFHIAGGGNNLREKNPVWSEYRLRVEKHGLGDWPTMREALRKGNIPAEIQGFLIKHRNRNVIPDADTEIREYFRWYFEVLHPEENIGKWKSEPEASPKDSWAEIRNYVEEQYMQVLGRHADEEGKQIYTDAIVSGKIKRDDLPNILRASPEYKEKFQRTAENISVGAIVLAKNEEKNIEKCLTHLKPHVDFLFVLIDAETNDKTVEISKKFADATLVRHFSGSFSTERNYSQNLVPTEWVLHCDADETFNEDFLKNMKQIISKTAVESFRFPRINPEKRDWPDYQVRLFRKANIQWRKTYAEIPYYRPLNKPIDQVNVLTLDEYPIIHTGDKKDWAKILGQTPLV